MSQEKTAKSLKDEISALKTMLAQLRTTIKDSERKNQFFEMLISSLPGLFYVFDDTFSIHMWNRNVEKVTGYTAEEIVDKDRILFEIFAEEDLKRMDDIIQNVFDTGLGYVETDLVTKDGNRIPYYFTGVSTKIDNVSYLLGMGLDISQRKQAEDELRESEALYRLFAERMSEGVLLCQKFKILFANNALASMIGHREPSDMLSKDVMGLVADGFDMYFMEMYEALESNIAKERFFQARWVTQKGKEIWVEGRGNLIQWKGQRTVLLTARDITEAKKREISMQEEAENLRRENTKLRSSIKDRYRFGKIIGKSLAMQKIYELILNAAATSANVIIYGESGTGKELVANAIHDMSARAQKAFVPVNCAAIPENLLESEFFGYKKGAFTGATTDKLGYLDVADGGTLFLDEVGELSTNLQVKLLRAIEGGGYSPIGSSFNKTSNFRIVAATNQNLLERSKQGLVREDFFFRIHIIPIHMPPLRERKDDIPLLVEHFLRIYAENNRIRVIPGREMEALIKYDWPGNVRELQNVIQRYLAVKSLDFLSPLQMETQRIARNPNNDISNRSYADPGDASLQGNVQEVEKAVIKEAMIKFKGNKSRAAESLGISRKTLARKIKRFGLS